MLCTGKKANKYFRFDADKKEFVYINELSQKEKEHVAKVRALRALHSRSPPPSGR